MNFLKRITDYRKAQIFNLLRYTSDALIYAFLPLFFHSLDLSTFYTGALLASVPIMAIVGNLVMSFLCKSNKRNMMLLKILMPIEIIACSLIGFFNNFVIVLILSMVMNFCNSSFYALLDGVCSSISTNEKKNYAGIRIFGSIAYLFSSFCGGFLIDHINYCFTFLIAGGVWCIDYFLLFTFKEIENQMKLGDEKENEPYANPLKNKQFILYFFFYILILSASHSTDTFFSLYAKDVKGISSSNYGILYSSMILTEIIVMFITLKVKFKKNSLMLIISSGFLFTRIFLLCFDLPKEALYFIPSLRGIGWGLLLAFHINTLKTFLKSNQMAKAILYLSIGLQTLVAVFNEIGPQIYSNFSYNLLFIILTSVAALGVLLIVIFNLVFRKKKVSD